MFVKISLVVDCSCWNDQGERKISGMGSAPNLKERYVHIHFISRIEATIRNIGDMMIVWDDDNATVDPVTSNLQRRQSNL
jgi:hypothetical protein